MSKKKNLIITGIATAGVVAAIAFTMAGLSNTVSELSTEISKTKVDAILANADISDDTTVAVPILYFDQTEDACVNIYESYNSEALNARQFEWTKCGYYNKNLEQGMVDTELSAEYLPVANDGEMLPNRGIGGDNFYRWFHAMEGKSKSAPSVLNMAYNEKTASFEYESENFYPLDNTDEHNHLFTFSLGVPFQLRKSGDEKFEITADDDTFVFVNNKLVLDMGGVHDAMYGVVQIAENGELYTAIDEQDLAYSGVTLDSSDSAIVRIFHADRDSSESVFKLKFDNMVLNMTNATLAKNSDGVMVAYDPSDPSYVAPLGESMTFTPNRSRAMLAASVAMASVLGVLAVVLIIIISVAYRYSRRDRNPEE